MKTDGPMITHLIAGRGRAQKRDPLTAAALEVCGKSDPVVACVGAANGDNPIFSGLMKSVLLAAGAGEVVPVKLAGRKSDVGRARAQLEAADIVFMSGGDVEAGMNTLVERGLVDYLRGIHASGKPFFGLSAGSIMLCRAWVRWSDPDDDATAETFPCLGLSDVLCDTHAEDDGFAELRTLLGLLDDGEAGFGIPSGAAIAVSGRGKVTALGGPVWRFSKRKGEVIRLDNLSPA
jgi:cyanophycinase-like exopeptidase